MRKRPANDVNGDLHDHYRLRGCPACGIPAKGTSMTFREERIRHERNRLILAAMGLMYTLLHAWK